MSAVMDLIKPDDFHHHFRDGDALPALVPLVAKRFRRAVRQLPNLVRRGVPGFPYLFSLALSITHDRSPCPT